MENRIIIKSINFNMNYEQDIKIKLYHNKINLISDIIYEYENNDIINWKFIFDYNTNFSIDFMILENDIFEQNNIIGHGIIQKNNTKFDSSSIVFPQPIISKINIEKNNIITCTLNIEQYIIFKDKSSFYQCGPGWSLPDNYPKLNLFPYKDKNNIFQHIKIIEDNYIEESHNELYTNAFLKILNDTSNKPPICFGISAPDNYGKSRLLQSLKKKLLLSNDKVVIDFNPWNFEAADTIWASVLMSINSALEIKFGKLNLKLLRIKKYATISFVLTLVIPFILLGVALGTYLTNTLQSIIIYVSLGVTTIIFSRNYYILAMNLLYSISDIISKKLKKKDWEKQLGIMTEIKAEFLDFINPIVKNYNCTLILLIDDLDKCSIEKIYSVIKVLSLLKYSDCPIYFFLTYDSTKINDAITAYYKNRNFLNSNEGKHLLDKLINIPFCLPEKSIAENITLLDKYIKNNNEALQDEEEVKITINSSPSFEAMIYFNTKDINRLDQIENILNNNVNLSFYQLENYYKYIQRIENDNIDKDYKKINVIKKIIYQKFIDLKKNFEKNYYIGLDKYEIKLLKNIIEETKYSGHCLNNSKIIKIINLYSIARFLLPNYLKTKKNKLFHLLLITENWNEIIISIYVEIKKIKMNLDLTKIKECFEDKELLFFYLNNENLKKNDELIIYLSKFEIKIIDFIDLEIYLINLDRCLIF